MPSFADALLAKLQHISESGVRVALVREAVLNAEISDLVSLLAATIERGLAGEAPGEDTLLALVPTLATLHREGHAHERIAEAYNTAAEARDALESGPSEDATVAPRSRHWLRYAAVCNVLFEPPPHASPPKMKVRFGPRWGRHVTLGERKTFAAGGNRQHLEKLLYDADASVIARICANPRITEQDVLLVATRRPNAPELLAEVVSSKWLASYKVRHALSLNPYNSTGTVLRLLPLLHAQDLAATRYVGDVHPLVRRSAEQLTTLRELLLAREHEPLH